MPTTSSIKNTASATANVAASTAANATDEVLRKKYQKKSQYEHIRDLPDTYIGSIVKDYSDQYVAVDFNENNVVKTKITKKRIEFIPGFYKIFDEIIVNSNDNRNRILAKIEAGEKDHIKMATMKVNIFKYSDAKQPEKHAISVWNDGDGIDVAMHPDEKIYIPEMIFGHLLTSGNYDKAEEKITGGKNGYGAKLVNIFSTFFKIETVDKKNKLRYTQIFRNMMTEKEPPIIEPFKGAPYTCITFIPDYAKFGITDMTPNLHDLFKKRTYDMIFCSQDALTVYFNDLLLNTKNLQDYMRMYLHDNLDAFKQSVSSTASNTADSPSKSNDASKTSTGETNTELTLDDVLLSYCTPHTRWQIGACMSPDFTFRQVSFVNGICTTYGGKHVDYVEALISAKLVKWINKKYKIEVKKSFIRDNLMVFINAIIVNPGFDSQTKGTLTTAIKDFGSKIEDIPDDFIEMLAKSGIAERAVDLNKFQDTQLLKKSDGKKTRRISDIPKLDDAGYAGDSKHSSKCTLILTEGDSAKAMAVGGISVIEKGRDYYGIFPLRGKLLNTRDKADAIIAQNAEICNIKRILGLQEGEVYEDTKKLRYGRIMIMTDADHDGSHIKGLIMNYIASHFPSLLRIEGFITSLMTPIIKATKGTGTRAHILQFHTMMEFEKWLRENNAGKGYKIKYYKGLGTSTPLEAKEYFRDFKLITYHWDDNTSDTIDKAFNGDRSDDRKTWLLAYNGQVLDLGQMRVSFSDFIDREMIQFSMADNDRSIPNLMDGLKPSLRKILFSCFKRKLTEEIKVAQLAGYVSENAAYHHGEASLNGTIVNMAQNFCGTNNLNLLEPIGQFGTRIQGGKDHAATRYIFTKLTNIANKIYLPADEALYKYIEDDGQKVEPVFYAPILPMILINGASGIGTGWSSELPQFNPLDILELIRGKIATFINSPDAPNPTLKRELVPWYRGFKGTIAKIGNNSWITKGVYKVIDTKTIEITELPVGVWTQYYKDLLESLMGHASTAKKPGRKSPKKSSQISASDKKKKSDSLLSVPVGQKAPETPVSDEVNLSKEAELIKDYKEYHTDYSVKFIVTFEPRILSALLSQTDKKGINALEKKLHLTTTLSCQKTLNFFGPDGKLHNLTSIEEIIDSYFLERMKLFRIRKIYLESQMNKEIMLIGAKAKFILDVVNNVIIVNRRNKADIIGQLRTHNYPIMYEKVLYTYEALTKKAEETGDTDVLDKGHFNYLLDLPIHYLTQEKIEELIKDRDQVNDQLTTLKSKTPGDLWLEDLAVFEMEYVKYMKEFYEYTGLNPAHFNDGVNRKVSKFNLSGISPSTKST